MTESNAGNATRICILGKETLQTSVLGDFLSRELDASCVVHEDLDTCLNVAALSTVRTILLLDAAHRPFREIVDRIRSQSGIPDHIVPALLNLPHETGIEPAAIHEGIRGFFYFGDGSATLVKGIRMLLAGEPWIARRVLLKAALHAPQDHGTHQDGRQRLTQRETEILAMICVGARNEEIAAKLYISTNTVKTHIYNIYKKIHVPNRTQAALWAAKNL